MEPVEGLQYLKLIDLGRQIVTNDFHGYIPGMFGCMPALPLTSLTWMCAICLLGAHKQGD